jgi:hypothetical protein
MVSNAPAGVPLPFLLVDENKARSFIRRPGNRETNKTQARMRRGNESLRVLTLHNGAASIRRKEAGNQERKP